LGFDLVTHLRTPETDHLHVYSLWLCLVVLEFGPRCEPRMRNDTLWWGIEAWKNTSTAEYLPYVSLKFHQRKLYIFAIFRQLQS
jgi:hypothetical protein